MNEIGSAMLTGIGVVTLVSLAINIKYEVKIPPAIWSILAVLMLVGFVVNYTTVSQNLIGSGATFLALMVALKLFDLRTTRDHLLIYLLVFLEIIITATSTISPLFFAVLAAFVITSIWAMVLFNIKRDYEQQNGKNKIITTRGLLSPSFFLYTVAITLLSLIITLMIFLIIPRIGTGLFNQETLKSLSVPGFADELSLGSIGRGKGYDHIVMRVEFPDASGAPANMYMKGTTLDHYDGRNWRRTGSAKKKIQTASNGIIYSALKSPGRISNQIITLEPLDTNIIFAATPWARLKGDFKELLTDDSGTLYMKNKTNARLTYSVWSGMNGRESANLSPAEQERYLQLPPLDVEDTKKIKAFAKLLTEEEPGNYKKSRKIENFLRLNYRYTLEPKKGQGKTPLEDFLFYAKEGFCEHYATSMVVMLRTLGIPARVVTGYIQGQWNNYGNYLLLRQRDTHSWVEAYLTIKSNNIEDKNNGATRLLRKPSTNTYWVRFDPTASQGRVGARETSQFALYLDALKWRWTKTIVNYSLTDQIKVAITLRHNTNGLRLWFRSLMEKLPSLKGKASKGQTAPLVLALILMATALIVIIINKSKARGNIKTPEFYLEMQRILKKKGLERKEQETPMEFARRAGSKEVEEITGFFQVRRYRKTTLSIYESTRLKTLMKKIKE
jgi:transglutaminase-like putative cysteine protease